MTAEAAAHAEEVARTAREIAAAAAKVAEEAGAKAAAALPAALLKKLLSSWEFLTFAVVLILSTVLASVAFSIFVSSGGLK